MGLRHSGCDWKDKFAFEPDRSEHRKGVGESRKRELEERRHWIEIDRSEEDIDWGNSWSVVAELKEEVAVSVGVTGSGGNEVHYWSVGLVDMPSGNNNKSRYQAVDNTNIMPIIIIS